MHPLEPGVGFGGEGPLAFIFPNSSPDMIIFVNTSSARKQQYKLFILKFESRHR